MTNNETHCADCGSEFEAIGGGTGYGQDREGIRRCYNCCAERYAADMARDGRGTLYLTRDAKGFHYISDWAGAMRYPATSERMRHPFAREAYCGRFRGPDGKQWSYRNIGDSQIAHCRRLKAQ